MKCQPPAPPVRHSEPRTALQALTPGPGPARDSRAKDFSEWTTNLVNYDETDVPPKAFMDTRGAERARAHILIRFCDIPRPSYRQLQKELGFRYPSVVGNQVKRLVEEGLLQKRGRDAVITHIGRTCAQLIQSFAGGESCWRQIVKKAFGVYTRGGSQQLKEAARKLDFDYALKREGMHRRAVDGGFELERKVTYKEILRALRRYTTFEGAARHVGLKRQALQDRIKTMVTRAQRDEVTS